MSHFLQLSDQDTGCPISFDRVIKIQIVPHPSLLERSRYSVSHFLFVGSRYGVSHSLLDRKRYRVSHIFLERTRYRVSRTLLERSRYRVGHILLERSRYRVSNWKGRWARSALIAQFYHITTLLYDFIKNIEIYINKFS